MAAFDAFDALGRWADLGVLAVWAAIVVVVDRRIRRADAN